MNRLTEFKCFIHEITGRNRMNAIGFDPLNFGNSAHLDFAGRWLGEQAVQSMSRAMVAAAHRGGGGRSIELRS